MVCAELTPPATGYTRPLISTSHVPFAWEGYPSVRPIGRSATQVARSGMKVRLKPALSPGSRCSTRTTRVFRLNTGLRSAIFLASSPGGFPNRALPGRTMS